MTDLDAEWKAFQNQLSNSTQSNYIAATIKEEVELPISHDLAYYVAEWLETLVSNAALEAENNATVRGDERITAAHWPPSTDLGNQSGYWEDNREWAKDYKQYLMEK